MRLFHRLLWYFLPTTFLLVLVFSWIVQRIVHDNLLNSAHKEIQAVADIDRARLIDQLAHTAERLDAFNSRLLVRRLLAQSPDSLLPPEAAQQVQKVIEESSQYISSFQRLYLLNLAGTVVATNHRELIDQPFQWNALLALANDKPVLASFASENGQLTLWSAVALELDGQPVGHLVVGSNAKHVLQILADVSELGETANSILLTQGQAGLAITPSEHAPIQTRFDNTQQALIKTQAGKAVFEGNDMQGRNTLFAVHEIPEVGWLHLTSISRDEALAPLTGLRWTLAFGGLLAMVIMFGVVVVLSQKLARPIEALADTARKIESGERTAGFPQSDTLELNGLARMIKQLLTSLQAYQADLEGLVTKRTAELEKANEARDAAVTTLQRTLHRSASLEKLAALGALVPSVLEQANASKQSNSKATSPQAPEQHIQSTSQQLQTLVGIAEYQSDDSQTTFVLHQYVEELIALLTPIYAHAGVTIQLSGDATLEVQTNRASLLPVFSHLLSNAVRHGFEGQTEGSVHIQIQCEHEEVSLVFQDDGKGMPEDTAKEAFVFPSNAQKGHGLFVVYHLVTDALKGKVSVDSKPGEGYRVMIRFPQGLS